MDRYTLKESIKSTRLFGIELLIKHDEERMDKYNARGNGNMASNEMENETFLGTVCQTCTRFLTGCAET